MNANMPTTSDNSLHPQQWAAQQSDKRTRGDSRRDRALESLWEWVGQPLLRITFHNWYGVRRALLSLFGATVHPTARIRPSAIISHPWRLVIGASSSIGDHAIVHCLGDVTIGDGCTISQYVHLCTATYDYERSDMPVIVKPIVIEDDVWLAADVFVGPGVTIAKGAVVGARSTVMKSLREWSIYAGDSAKPVAKRVLASGCGSVTGALAEQHGVLDRL